MEVGLKEDEDGDLLIVISNMIPIVVLSPKETIVYVNESLKSLYKSMLTLKGAITRVTNFQMTLTMFVVMRTLVIEGEINKKAKMDQIVFKLVLKQCFFVIVNQQATKVLSLFNIMIVDKKVQPNKHVHPPFQSTT
jgi:dipeptide/tripeptide permease